MEDNSKKIQSSKKRLSSINAKKEKKRSRKKSSNDNDRLKNSIPIFTDEFLDLFRKQKSEIRSLKLNYSQLSEEFKFKDAQQEQIRLDNQKMCADIEDISHKNSLLNNQIDQLEKQFNEHFPDHLQFDLFEKHINDEDYQLKMKKILENVQL